MGLSYLQLFIFRLNGFIGVDPRDDRFQPFLLLSLPHVGVHVADEGLHIPVYLNVYVNMYICKYTCIINHLHHHHDQDYLSISTKSCLTTGSSVFFRTAFMEQH